MAQRKVNKFGVSHHYYEVFLGRKGDSRWVDVGDETDWGNIQPCTPGDCRDWANAIGWGNDSDGHTKITAVVDNRHIWKGNREVKKWFDEKVAVYAEKYGA